MKNPMLMTCVVLGGLACLLGLVGLVTIGWANSDVPEVTFGLFSQCMKDNCRNYAATKSVATSKAFAVIGWLCSVAAVIVTIVYFFKYAAKDVSNKSLPLIGAIFYFISGTVCLLAATIFGAAGKQHIESIVKLELGLGYSFALTIIAALLSLSAGILAILHRQRIGGT